MIWSQRRLWWLVIWWFVASHWAVAQKTAETAPEKAPEKTPVPTSFETYDVLITNARVVDGTGNPWFRAEVAIKDGYIVRVGRKPTGRATTVVDAKGHILAPGFIDVHAHVEDIFRYPEAENFIRMGVTTLVTGNCGSSVTDVGAFLGATKKHR
ncbi:amidohydrolase family protein [Chloracidobacterium aggregatum]|uniref:amidohydrolase family protein n=1 Tax=Chloracidobacterium aggregatum TaxID=2851959 RepID=UPI0024B6341D|nr:amidohydrolase family protein [Chloracidobacterium aggregatum]